MHVLYSYIMCIHKKTDWIPESVVPRARLSNGAYPSTDDGGSRVRSINSNDDGGAKICGWRLYIAACMCMILVL